MPLTAVVTKLTFYISLWILCVLIEFSVCYTSHSTGEYEKKKKKIMRITIFKNNKKKKGTNYWFILQIGNIYIHEEAS